MIFRRMQWLLLGGVCVAVCSFSNIAAEETTSLHPKIKDLCAECRKAKSIFQSLSLQDLYEAKGIVAESVARLEQRLDRAGPVGDAWRSFLEIPRLKDQLKPDAAPEIDVLRRILEHFNFDGEGLELACFLDVGQALENYVALIKMAAIPDQRVDYENKMDKLADVLGRYSARQTSDDAVTMRQGLRWLKRTKQARPLIGAIEEQFIRPNFYFDISAKFLSDYAVEPFSTNEPIRDCILDADIYATSRSTGRTTTAVSMHPSLAVFDKLSTGTATADNIGYYGRVTIFSTSTSNFAARKRIWIDADGIHAYPAVSSAVTDITISDIHAARLGRRLVEKIAWRKVYEKLDEAERITSRHTEGRVNKWVDGLAIEQIENANRLYRDEFRRPLAERKLFPQKLQFRTTENAISLTVLQAGNGMMAAPDIPPPVVPNADLWLRIHQSMANNLAFDALAGHTLHEEKVQAAIRGLLGELPEKLKSEGGEKPWAITFSKRQPISLEFLDGGLKLTIHGTKFREGSQAMPEPMDISAAYDIERTKKGFRLVRRGGISASSPEQSDSKAEEERVIDPKAMMRQFLGMILAKRFEKVFAPEFPLAAFDLPEEWKMTGHFELIQFDSRGGWLSIAWKWIPA